MTFDPYDALGVPKNADDKAIKAAYRRKAKQTHPDHGGTAEKFNAVNRAMLILVDPERRAKYDRTGDADDVAPDNALPIAVSIIVGFFSSFIQQAVQRGQDPCHHDIVDLCRKHFQGQIAAFEKEKKPIVKMRDTLEKVVKRLKKKKNANQMVQQALLNQAASTAEPLRNLDRKIQEVKDALVLIDEYEFEKDNPPSPTMHSQSVWTFHTGGTGL